MTLKDNELEFIKWLDSYTPPAVLPQSRLQKVLHGEGTDISVDNGIILRLLFQYQDAGESGGRINLGRPFRYRTIVNARFAFIRQASLKREVFIECFEDFRDKTAAKFASKSRGFSIGSVTEGDMDAIIFEVSRFIDKTIQ